MQFFNPASLLPDPSVAVKPPPAGNQGFIIQEALKEVGGLVKKKFDVDALKQESNLLADYVQEKSPQLASYLRESASSYNLGTTDPNQVRGNLLKGTLSMLESEQRDRKIDATAAMEGQYNMFGTKLSNDQKEYSDSVSAFNTFEKEENDREAAHNERNKYLRSQNQFTTAFKRRENPHAARMNQAKVNFEATRKSTPNVVPKKASEPFLPTGGSPSQATDLFPGQVVEEATGILPGAQAEKAPAPAQNSVLGSPPPAESVATPEQSAIITGVEPPSLVTDKSPPVGTNSVLKPKPVTGTMQPPGFENTPENAAVLAARKSDTELVQKQADAIISQLTENEALYINKDAYKAVKEEAKKIIAEIEALPDPGSATWKTNAKALLRILKDRTDGLVKNTVTQENKEVAIENQQPLQFKVAGGSRTIPGFLRKINGEDRYFANKDGVNTDVTNDFRKGTYQLVETTASGVSVTKPGAPIPKSMLKLIQEGKK